MNRIMKQISVFVFLVAFGLLVTITVKGQDKKVQEKGKYESIEVVNFEVKEGVVFPPDYAKPMMDEIVSKLTSTKKFKQVMRAGETPTDPNGAALKLIGTVTEFKPGNRATRYLISMGAGKTRIVAHVKFLNKSSGEILYEGDVSGGVSWGVFGGDSKGAASGVGKQIAEVAKKRFF